MTRREAARSFAAKENLTSKSPDAKAATPPLGNPKKGCMSKYQVTSNSKSGITVYTNKIAPN